MDISLNPQPATETAIKVSIFNQQNQVLFAKSAYQELAFSYKAEYQAGDYFLVEVDHQKKGVWLVVELEDSFAPTLCYVQGKSFSFTIPQGDNKRVYSEKAFTGGLHFIRVRLAYKEEILSPRNILANPYFQDQFLDQQVYPQVQANFTAGNIRFAARCVIDGAFDTNAHGSYPFTSWSTGNRNDACLIFKLAHTYQLIATKVYLRADFPHDNYIKKLGLRINNQHQLILNLTRHGKAQSFKVPYQAHELSFNYLERGSDKPEYTAISQIEVWGKLNPEQIENDLYQEF